MLSRLVNAQYGTNKGFTLLELMIAITLMAFLSIMTTQSIQRAVKTKTKMQKNIEMNSGVRDAIRVMERDIQQAFHYRDFSVDMFNQALTAIYKPQPGQQNAQQPNQQGQQPNLQGQQDQQNLQQNQNQALLDQQLNQKKKRPYPQYTFFFGEEEKLTLTTRTNARTFMDQRVSDQLRVSYYLETCKLRRDLTKTTKCLWRKTDPYFDESVEMRNGNAMVLLEGVESLKLRYMGDPQRREWSRDWKSKEGDPSMREKFPLAVEVTLNVIDPGNEKAKPVTVQTVAQIRNPNNEDLTKKQTQQQPGVPSGMQPGMQPGMGMTPTAPVAPIGL